VFELGEGPEGERLGLRRSDVDLTNGRIAIRRTLVMVDGKPATAEPKTARFAALSRWLRRSWRQSVVTAPERLSWGAGYTDSGLVITTEDGRPMHPETLSGLFVRQARRVELLDTYSMDSLVLSSRIADSASRPP
jgi:hypothetical protein